MAEEGSRRWRQATAGMAMIMLVLLVWTSSSRHDGTPISTSSALLSSISSRAGALWRSTTGYLSADQVMWQSRTAQRQIGAAISFDAQRSSRLPRLRPLFFPTYHVRPMEFPQLKWKKDVDFSTIQDSDEMISKVLGAETSQVAVQQRIRKETILRELRMQGAVSGDLHSNTAHTMSLSEMTSDRHEGVDVKMLDFVHWALAKRITSLPEDTIRCIGESNLTDHQHAEFHNASECVGNLCSSS